MATISFSVEFMKRQGRDESIPLKGVPMIMHAMSIPLKGGRERAERDIWCPIYAWQKPFVAESSGVSRKNHLLLPLISHVFFIFSKRFRSVYLGYHHLADND